MTTDPATTGPELDPARDVADWDRFRAALARADGAAAPSSTGAGQ